MTKEQREIRKLKRKCWKLLSKKIREKFGRCFFCGSTEHLNVHHLEDARLYPELYLDENNLVCLCVHCHKWGKGAVHKSFVTAYFLWNELPKGTLEYLASHRDDNFKFTIGYLENRLKELESGDSTKNTKKSTKASKKKR